MLTDAKMLCKNKNTGELSICSMSCKYVTENKIKGVCVCEPVGDCGNSPHCLFAYNRT